MKRLLSLVAGIVVFMATNVSSLWADSTVIRGKIKSIRISNGNTMVEIEVVTSNHRVHRFWDTNDSPLVPVIATAFETQSDCEISTPDPSTDPRRWMTQIKISRGLSITNKNIMDTLNSIEERLEEIEARMSIRPVWRQQ